MTDGASIGDLAEEVQQDGRTQMLEAEAKRLLAAAGIQVPTHKRASSPSAAVEAAEVIGYPVVVKVSAQGVQHKSDWADGAGVALDLNDAESVRTSAQRVFEAAESAGVSAEVLVEEAVGVETETEVIVAGIRDESFGPVVMFGLGGTFAEVLQDTSHRLAPVKTTDAEEMLDDIQGTELLDGYRGQAAVNRDSLAETITSVGNLLVERETLQEVEINPLLATADGEPIALDALVTLR